MNGLTLPAPSPLTAAKDSYYQFGREQVKNAIERFEARNGAGVDRSIGRTARKIWSRMAMVRTQSSAKTDAPPYNLFGKKVGRWHPALVVLGSIALAAPSLLLLRSKIGWLTAIGAAGIALIFHIQF